MLCVPCLGSGQFPAGQTCGRCGGRGTLPDQHADRPMCPYCIGTGRDPFHKGHLCSLCEGWGRVPERKVPAPANPTDGNASVAEDGRRAAGHEGSLSRPGGVELVSPTPSPRSLEDLLRDMAGDVDVCEPFLASDDFERIALLRGCDMVRVLAQEVEQDVLARIRPFTREFPHFLFRKYLGRAIRDRYVLTHREVIFLGPRPEAGNGASEALIRVPATVAGEMIEDVRVGYNRQWRAADRLG